MKSWPTSRSTTEPGATDDEIIDQNVLGLESRVSCSTRNARLETRNCHEGSSFMDGQAIIQPGVQALMESRYFSELRQGKLTIKRLQGWAIQHYLHNKAILRSFALGMVKNAHDPEMFGYFSYQFNEEQFHPDLAKRFGLALGLKEEDFSNAT